jgi:hypothetical protein
MVILRSFIALLNARYGEVSASLGQQWRIVFASVALLTVSLTVAVHPSRKPFKHKAFTDLTTGGHG